MESLTVSDVSRAVAQARSTLHAADACVGDMARLIAGRLRTGNVSSYVLQALKKELQGYNMHTGSWRSDK